MHDSPPRSPWPAVAAWCALALALLRLAAIGAMTGLAHAQQAHLVRLRLAAAAPGVVLEALAVAALAAGAGALARRASAARRAPAALALLLAATLFALALTGRLAGDRSLQVGLETGAGRLASAALAVAATTLAALLLRALRHPPAARARPATGLVLPLLLAGALPLLLQALKPSLRGEMELREVAHELLADAGALRVVRARPDAPPQAGLLCPSTDFRVDGADLPALLLPPPAEVRLALPAGGGPLRLRARAGLDARALGRPELAGARLRFELELDGREAFAWEADLGPARTRANNAWQPVGGAAGLEVAPGAELTLRTRVLDASGAALVPAAPLAAGFGELLLERRTRLPRRASSPREPNIVLVVMDALRADRLSTYGYARPTSPRLDALAARGLLFEQALSASSWTWPSTASFLTGLLPQEHGVQDDATCVLAHGATTLAEALQRAGLTTAAWSANPLVAPDRGFAQGFETFDPARGRFRASADFLPAVLDWLTAAAGTRFFLYLHLADTHVPHLPLPEARALLAADVPADYPPGALHDESERLLAGGAPPPPVDPALGRSMSDMYDACVRTGDHALGAVLDRLAALGLEDETVVVFTSDHGEELLDHGLLGHGQSLHGELLRVPLVLAGPGIPAGRRAAPVSNRHLAPTLARLAGAVLDGPADALDLLDERLPAAPELLSTRHGWWNGRHRVPLLGARSGPLLLHWSPEGAPPGAAPPAPGGELRLYDLSSDPLERRDLAAERPDAAAALRAWIEERVARAEAQRVAPGMGAGEATLEMLRQVGYLGAER